MIVRRHNGFWTVFTAGGPLMSFSTLAQALAFIEVPL